MTHIPHISRDFLAASCWPLEISVSIYLSESKKPDLHKSLGAKGLQQTCET